MINPLEREIRHGLNSRRAESQQERIYPVYGLIFPFSCKTKFAKPVANAIPYCFTLLLYIIQHLHNVDTVPSAVFKFDWCLFALPHPGNVIQQPDIVSQIDGCGFHFRLVEFL